MSGREPSSSRGSGESVRLRLENAAGSTSEPTKSQPVRRAAQAARVRILFMGGKGEGRWRLKGGIGSSRSGLKGATRFFIGSRLPQARREPARSGRRTSERRPEGRGRGAGVE